MLIRIFIERIYYRNDMGSSEVEDDYLVNPMRIEYVEVERAHITMDNGDILVTTPDGVQDLQLHALAVFHAGAV